MNKFNILICFTTCISNFSVFRTIYNKYFAFVLMLIFAYKHDIITCFLLLNVLKDIMEGLKSIDKAAWTNEMLHTFCDLWIKAIDMRMRPNTHFDKTRWKFLITSFKEQTDHAFTKTQLKNKWDWCKKDWRIWTKLVSETSVGCSSELETISASNEWWKAKIQDNSSWSSQFHLLLSNFIKKNLIHDVALIILCRKLEEPKNSNMLVLNHLWRWIWQNVFQHCRKGEFAWAPSSGVLGGNEVDPGISNVNINGANLKEGRVDSEEDV